MVWVSAYALHDTNEIGAVVNGAKTVPASIAQSRHLTLVLGREAEIRVTSWYSGFEHYAAV